MKLHPRQLLSRRALQGPPPRRGFSLVEMLAVLAIVATLVAMVSAAVSVYASRAQRERTRATLAHLAQGLETFKDQYGSYPYHDPAAAPCPYHTDDPCDLDCPMRRWSGALTDDAEHYEIRNLYGLLRETGALPEPLASRFLREAEDQLREDDYDLIVLDGWEQPIVYRYPRWDEAEDRERIDRFDLWSKGPSRRDSRENPEDPHDPSDREDDRDKDNVVWGEF